MSSFFACINPLFVNLLTSGNLGFVGVALWDGCGIPNVGIAEWDSSSETSCKRTKYSFFVIIEIEVLLLVGEPSFAKGETSELEGPVMVFIKLFDCNVLPLFWSAGVTFNFFSTTWSAGVTFNFFSTAWSASIALNFFSTAWSAGVTFNFFSTAWSASMASIFFLIPGLLFWLCHFYIVLNCRIQSFHQRRSQFFLGNCALYQILSNLCFPSHYHWCHFWSCKLFREKSINKHNVKYKKCLHFNPYSI